MADRKQGVGLSSGQEVVQLCIKPISFGVNWCNSTCFLFQKTFDIILLLIEVLVLQL